MKKIYVLLSAASVALTASAVQKEMAVHPSQPIQSESVQIVKSEAGPALARASFVPQKTAKTRADEVPSYAFFRPSSSLMTFSPNAAGHMYGGMGFASSYGNVDFFNFSSGMKSCEWIYSDLNDYVVEENKAIWTEKSSSSEHLSIKSGLGMFPAPILYITPEDGGKEELYEINISMIRAGGGADYWGINSEVESEQDEYGLTFYQNTGLFKESSKGNSNGSLCNPNAYKVNTIGFGANGLCNSGQDSWKSTLESAWFRGAEVTDIKLNNFSIIQPKPKSTYMMTRGWIWMDVKVKAATQLLSYIYPIDAEGHVSDVPIAIGYAAIPAEGTNTPVFYYTPLNEDGDEIEDVVYIDSAVLVTIEGFVGNEAVTSVSPVSGYYPFSYKSYISGNYDICRDPDLLLDMDVTADGELYEHCLVWNLGLYGFDETGEILTSLCYPQFNMDATFAYIHSADDVYEINIPLDGGTIETEVDALYYNIKKGIEEGWYELSAPEWLTVEVGEPDSKTDLTKLTITAAAGEDRTGYVTIEGVGVIYTLTVNQGEGNAVSSIVVDKNAEYFDLQGRKVANPGKGLYIKKAGNKTSKVIL